MTETFWPFVVLDIGLVFAGALITVGAWAFASHPAWALLGLVPMLFIHYHKDSSSKWDGSGAK